MYKTRRALLPAILLLMSLSLSPLKAQTRTHAATTDPLMLLPASDVVLIIDHSRILNEAIPRLFGNDTAPLAKIFAAGEEFKAKTGIDPRTISRIVVGLRFVNPDKLRTGPDKKDLAIVIIAQGDFDANKFVSFMRSEGKERVREEQAGGQTIYTIDERPKGSTQPKPEVEVPALVVLDANTIAIGDLAQVRATMDARGGGVRLSPELVALATRNSNALVSLAGNVPPGLTASLAPKGSSGNAELDQTVNKFFEAVTSIKQAYVSVGLTANGIEAQLGARLASAELAQSLGDILLGARQQYGVFIEDKIIRDLVNNMQLTAEGDEIQLRAEVPQTIIKMMLSNMKAGSPPAKAGSPPPAAVTKSSSSAPVTRQTRKKGRRSTRRKKG